MKPAFVVSAGMVACLAAPLPAQKKANLDGEKILADFARCAVRAAPRETRKLLDTVPGSEGEAMQIDFLIRKQSNCVKFGSSIEGRQLAAAVSLGQTTMTQAVTQLAEQQRQMTFSGRALRGAIAERVYLESAAAKDIAPPSLDPNAERDAALPAGYAVVRCAAERDPISAERLVHAKRLSSAEAEAARAWAPALNICARGKEHIDISGTAIHGWAAEALYKQRRPVAMESR